MCPASVGQGRGRLARRGSVIEIHGYGYGYVGVERRRRDGNPLLLGIIPLRYELWSTNDWRHLP